MLDFRCERTATSAAGGTNGGKGAAAALGRDSATTLISGKTPLHWPYEYEGPTFTTSRESAARRQVTRTALCRPGLTHLTSIKKWRFFVSAFWEPSSGHAVQEQFNDAE